MGVRNLVVVCLAVSNVMQDQDPQMDPELHCWIWTNKTGPFPMELKADPPIQTGGSEQAELDTQDQASRTKLA